MFQSSHQLQEAYEKEGASHQNKSCSKTPTNQSQEAYQKEKGMKRVSLEEHSLAMIKTPHRSQEAYQKEKGMERVSLAMIKTFH